RFSPSMWFIIADFFSPRAPVKICQDFLGMGLPYTSTPTSEPPNLILRFGEPLGLKIDDFCS
ncbi:MAG: hypothetical protein IJC80_04725, partial [Clostridia bacterium]|nr:hypothetical protein [Clostridia bacterium]